MPRFSRRNHTGRFTSTPNQITSLMESEIIPTPLSHALPTTPVLNLHLDQYEKIFVTPKSPVVPLPGTPNQPIPRRRPDTLPTVEYKPPPPALVPSVVVDLSVSPISPKNDSGYADISSASDTSSAERDPFAVPCLGRRHSGSMYYNSDRRFHNVRDLEMVKYFKQGLFNGILPMEPDYDTVCFTVTSRHRCLADMALRSTLDYKLLLEWNKDLLGSAERPLTRSSKLRAGVQIWTPIPARYEDWLKSTKMHQLILPPPPV
jgi:hypothetical protein